MAAHPPPTPRFLHRLRYEACSAAVGYVGLAVGVSMLMAGAATAVDCALGEWLATAIVERMVESVASMGK